MMKEKYESLPLATLKDLAKARGLKGISTMKKAELIERMLEEDEKVKNNAKETVKELSANTGDKEVHDIDKLDSGITVRGILEVMQDMDLSVVRTICREIMMSMYPHRRSVDLILKQEIFWKEIPESRRSRKSSVHFYICQR